MLLRGKIFFTVQLLLLFLAVSFSQAVTTTAEDTLKPDSAKECAICHYSWVDTFFIEHKSTALATLPDKPTVAVSEMCFSCHDGSTVDSRKHVINDRKHQVGITPSEKIKVPEIFPLDEEGKMDCATCHSAHGVSTEPGIEKTIFLRISHENSEMCKMCHVDQAGGPEKGYHPIDKTTLKISKELIKYGGYVGNKPNQVICESCHVAHGGFTDKRLVLPIDLPSTHPVLCEACHGKTPGLNKEKSRNRFSHSVDVKPENAEIPTEWKNGNKVRLGSRGELVCVSCHVTHNAPINESLLTERNEKDSLCLQCHASQEKLIRGTKHDLTLMAPDAKNILGQTVSQSGPCSSCHLTHEGVGPFMWARTWKGEKVPPIGICKSCHEEGKCAEEAFVPETGGHPIGIKPEKPEKARDFPLFTATGKRNKRGSIYCSSCHNTHQWDPLDPNNKGSKEIKGDINNSFLRASNQDSILCLGCHKEKAAIEKTDHDLALSAPEERNVIGQTPEESGICGGCHLSHGGADSFMWGRELRKYGKSIMVQICLDCHSKDSCAEEKQIGENFHPIEVSVQETKEITLPLFLPEGKQDPRGMVFCSTCHDPHQWDPRDPEEKGEDGTPSDSFLRKTGAGEALLCKECHEDKTYIEKTDHDLLVTASEEKNKQDLLPEQSGLCGTCHAIHNAQTESFIWNRNMGPSIVANWNEEFTDPENIMTGLCTSCHMDGKCAGEKIPEYGLHPNRLYMALVQEKSDSLSQEEYEKFMDQFPIFTDKGEKSVHGDIVCVTCHDPHLWDSDHPRKGSGEKVEGNATNSFLRKDISFTFCASCHGEDALFKFKYFHKIKGRKKEEPVEEEEETIIKEEPIAQED